ncbi:MAG: hypothetical protein ACREQV_25500 [Candidatus Binatia bacterium]
MKLFTGWRILVISGLMAGPMITGCSATNPIVSEWRNPAYVAPSFKSVMVGGLSEQASIRRSFEDEFLAQLREAGVEAIPSYRYIAEEEKSDDTKLKQAARTAGADALIIARPVKVEQKTDFGPSYYPVPSFGIFGSNVGAVWQGPYGGPSVSRYTEYTSEATLYDLAKDEIVWTGTLKTSEPENVNTAVKSYVGAVINALKEKNLLGAKK